jgi:hypothetical protein
LYNWLLFIALEHKKSFAASLVIAFCYQVVSEPSADPQAFPQAVRTAQVKAP